VGPSKIDAVWVYVLNYGGGIVSVSSISFLVFHPLSCLEFFLLHIILDLCLLCEYDHHYFTIDVNDISIQNKIEFGQYKSYSQHQSRFILMKTKTFPLNLCIQSLIL